jgi:hypothetical protein
LVTINGLSDAISQSAAFSSEACSACILLAGASASGESSWVDSIASKSHSRGKVMYTGPRGSLMLIL